MLGTEDTVVFNHRHRTQCAQLGGQTLHATGTNRERPCVASTYMHRSDVLACLTVPDRNLARSRECVLLCVQHRKDKCMIINRDRWDAGMQRCSYRTPTLPYAHPAICTLPCVQLRERHASCERNQGSTQSALSYNFHAPRYRVTAHLSVSVAIPPASGTAGLCWRRTPHRASPQSPAVPMKSGHDR